MPEVLPSHSTSTAGSIVTTTFALKKYINYKNINDKACKNNYNHNSLNHKHFKLQKHVNNRLSYKTYSKFEPYEGEK